LLAAIVANLEPDRPFWRLALATAICLRSPIKFSTTMEHASHPDLLLLAPWSSERAAREATAIPR
jgi:hypothetical protein